MEHTHSCFLNACVCQQLFLARFHVRELPLNLVGNRTNLKLKSVSTICSSIRCCALSCGTNLTTSTFSAIIRGTGACSTVRRCTRSCASPPPARLPQFLHDRRHQDIHRLNHIHDFTHAQTPHGSPSPWVCARVQRPTRFHASF